MKVKVAVIQESPVFFNKEATLNKVAALAEAYAKKGCQLLVFPESFVPGYPRGFTFGATVGNRTEEGRALYAQYHENSIALEGNDLEVLEKIARDNQVYLILGITEKASDHGSLFCSMLYLSPTTGLLGVHRKIKPTGTERIIWAEGDASSLVTFDTPLGRLGGLICWENYMPLARISMYSKGVQIYIAPTADSREGWTATLQHIALEGRCFVLGCNQYFEKSMYPEEYLPFVQAEREIICRGGSMIVSPMGEVLQGPLWDEPGILTATLDLEEITKSKLDFDPNGHYTRNDLFEYRAKGQPETRKE